MTTFLSSSDTFLERRPTDPEPSHREAKTDPKVLQVSAYLRSWDTLFGRGSGGAHPLSGSRSRARNAYNLITIYLRKYAWLGSGSPKRGGRTARAQNNVSIRGPCLAPGKEWGDAARAQNYLFNQCLSTSGSSPSPGPAPGKGRRGRQSLK